MFKKYSVKKKNLKKNDIRNWISLFRNVPEDVEEGGSLLFV